MYLLELQDPIAPFIIRTFDCFSHSSQAEMVKNEPISAFNKNWIISQVSISDQ